MPIPPIVPPYTPLPVRGRETVRFEFDFPLKNNFGRVSLVTDTAPVLNSGKFLSSGSIYSALLKKISEPLTDGTAGQILATDGSGNRYWKDDSGMTSVTWESILDKPASFPPSSHKSSHVSGADAIAPSDIGAAAASHTHAGFVLRADFAAIDPETVSVYELARILKTGAI